MVQTLNTSTAKEWSPTTHLQMDARGYNDVYERGRRHVTQAKHTKLISPEHTNKKARVGEVHCGPRAMRINSHELKFQGAKTFKRNHVTCLSTMFNPRSIATPPLEEMLDYALRDCFAIY